jgi:hypothetical protein
MLTIQDLSKEVDMTAVRGGWSGCGDEDSEARRHCHREGDRDGDRDCDKDGRHRQRCEPDQRRFDCSAPVGSFINVGLQG